jgi:hypothetical protein
MLVTHALSASPAPTPGLTRIQAFGCLKSCQYCHLQKGLGSSGHARCADSTQFHRPTQHTCQMATLSLSPSLRAMSAEHDVPGSNCGAGKGGGAAGRHSLAHTTPAFRPQAVNCEARPSVDSTLQYAVIICLCTAHHDGPHVHTLQGLLLLLQSV